MRMSKLATLELQRKGALDLADALYNENERLKKQIAEASKRLSDALAYLPDISQTSIPECYLISGASIKELREIITFLSQEEKKETTT